MYQILKKRTEGKTPLLLIIGILLGGWIAFSPLIHVLRTARFDLYSIGMAIAQLILLIGIWNLRKWAVIAFALLALLGLVGAFVIFGKLSPAVIGIVLLARAIVLVPAIIYWKRMS